MSTYENLQKLVCKIENCLKCYKEFKNYQEVRIEIRHWYNKGPWFFPPYREVKGFFGTGKVVFICERPSTGTFPSKADELFYDLIKRYELEDAHITDLIKCRLKDNEKGKTKNKKEADESFNFYASKCFTHLLEELEILKPTLIVAVSEKVRKYLKEHLPQAYKDNLFENSMTHYSYACRYKKEEKLEEDFKSVKKWISQHNVKHTRAASSLSHR
ncbi:MAG: uracil-DNA glycosylase family protein [Candidatus Bathyarchaeales archaeon]